MRHHAAHPTSGRRTRHRQCGRRTVAVRKTPRIMLIQRATLLDGTATDIRVDACIVETGDLEPKNGEQPLDVRGATVIPGLYDHHVHLRSAAAALTSVRVGPV